MEIPTPYITRSKLFGDIMNEAKDKPNDMDLGRFVRQLVSEYREGKHSPPSDRIFDIPGAKVHEKRPILGK